MTLYTFVYVYNVQVVKKKANNYIKFKDRKVLLFNGIKFLEHLLFFLFKKKSI